MTAFDRITRRIIDSGVPLDRDSLDAAVRPLIAAEAPLAPETLVVDIVDGLIGLGPLERLLADPQISDILVNGPDDIWVERSGVLSRSDVTFPSEAAVVAAVERVLAPLGLRIDRAAPMVDARLGDGSRLHAVIPPVAVPCPIVAIRRFTAAVTSLSELVSAGAVDEVGGRLLADLVHRRRTIVVAGGTGTGKTTLLNVLSTEIPSHERVVTVEDAAELRLAGHVVRLEARPPNVEGAGEVTVQQLVRSALRLRPDRIIVGEVRGPEALDMIWALNTGHRGSMSTVHANSPDEALWRLETLALSGDRKVGHDAVRRQLRAAVDVIIQVGRVAGRRAVVAVGEVGAEGPVVPRWPQ